MNITYETITVPVMNFTWADLIGRQMFYCFIGFFTIYGIIKFIQNWTYCCSD